MHKNKPIFQDVKLDIMERTAQKIVTIVRTTLLVGHRMENAIVLDVLALYISFHFVKVKLFRDYMF